MILMRVRDYSQALWSENCIAQKHEKIECIHMLQVFHIEFRQRMLYPPSWIYHPNVIFQECAKPKI